MDKIKNKWFAFIFLFQMLCAFVMTGLIANSDEDYMFKGGVQFEFANEWEYEFDNAVTGHTSLPAKIDTENITSVKLTNIVPKITDNTYFMIRSSHTYVKIMLDGNVVYDKSVNKNDSAAWFNIPGNAYNEIRLDSEDSGRELTVIIEGEESDYISSLGKTFIGDRSTFFISLIGENAGNVISFLIMIIVCFILLGIWGVLKITTKMNYKDMLCLAGFTGLISLWELTESECIQFFMPEISCFVLVAYEGLMLMPIPMAMYFMFSKCPETRKRAKFAAIVPIAVWFVNNGLHFLGIMRMDETLIITQIMLVFEVFCMSYIQVTDLYATYQDNDRNEGSLWKTPIFGLMIMVPCMLVQIYRYIKMDENAYSVLITSIGILSYIISLAIKSVLRLMTESMAANTANETKSQFLANMSHEIRTPLNASMGFDELILREAKDRKISDYAASIHTAGESLMDIINSILDMSKIEAGKIEIEEVGYSTEQLLDNVLSIIASQAEKKGLDLICDIDPKLPAFLLGDNVHLRQIMINILNNAVKYTKKGSVTLKLHVMSIDKEKSTCEILVSVKDTGIGIRDEDREKLFSKFERLDHEKNKHVEGSGLGMSIVVKVLEAMGSKIQLISEYGKGSEFYFVLKQRLIGTGLVGEYEHGHSNSQGGSEEGNYIAPSAKILIVDDVFLNIQVTSGLLEKLNVQTEAADSGYQAIEKVKNTRYDVILMDHMMPGMDGIETTIKIRELASQTGDDYYSSVPILALTANVITGMRETFLDNGMQDFVSKPVDGNELMTVLRKWIPPEKIIEDVENEDVSEENEEWYVDIPGIDIESARKFFTGKDAYLDTLKIYYDSSKGIYDKIRNYCDLRDDENYTITVHGLKSSSKIIGAMEVSEYAAMLEMHMGHGELKEGWNKTDGLLDLYSELTENIGIYLGAAQEEKIQIQAEELREALYEVISIAEEFDMDGLMEWEGKYASGAVEDKFNEKWEELTAYVREVSFMDIVQAANDMIELL